ncbi:efflux transporter outer membrane subunit [Alcaligenes phenolicus]|uniref:efflux transporter outer membrane subunit n=1 Tax=Alcaligenes phenolicus TaxID=232846 RepID=UPI0009F68AEA|nr:efflux transporter outer membrane subunit [Alcaligenes phenolicus]OQV31596.1 multidrug transporter [Alcaligenes phenolicus]
MNMIFPYLPRVRRLGPLALALILTGCTLAPKYERPAAPIEATYPASPLATEEASSAAVIAAEIGWRDFFRDPLLQQLIEISLANNRDFRTAALNVEAAQALYRIQRAKLLPELGATASGASERLPADLNPTGTSQLNRRYEVGGVSTAWELDLWGRIRSLNEQALTNYLALDETRVAAQTSLIAELANTYLTLRADQELLRLSSDTLATQQRSYELSRQLKELGHATQLDLRRAEVALRQAESSYAAYSRQAALDRNALVLLLGQALSADLSRQLDEAVTLPDQILVADLPGGLPSDLLVRRPDIRAAEQTLRGANAHIGAARAAFLPTISLTGSIGTASASLESLFDSGTRAWSFFPSINLPIFKGGALLANLDVAHVRKRIEIAQYEKTIQVAFREVADGLASKSLLDQQIQSEKLAVTASLEAQTLAEQRFQEGMDDYLSVLDAHRSLYSSQQTLIRTRLARLSNLIDLYKALGGGWKEYTNSADHNT